MEKTTVDTAVFTQLVTAKQISKQIILFREIIFDTRVSIKIPS